MSDIQCDYEKCVNNDGFEGCKLDCVQIGDLGLCLCSEREGDDQ